MELDTLSTFIKVGMNINNDFKTPAFQSVENNEVFISSK